MTLLAVLLALLAAFMAFVSAVLLLIGPVMLLQPYRRTVDYYRSLTRLLHPHDAGLPFEELTLETPDGIPLSCWLIKAQGRARGTILYLHGVSESKIVGLPLARQLHHLGYHVFLYDSRRHGDSGGIYCTYGFYEKYDAASVINYLVCRPDLEVGAIGVFGNSMGAAVAVQLASIDPRVKAVVAESGFATLRSVFDDYQKRMIKLPWHYLRNLVIRRSEKLAGFKASAVSPLESVRSVHVPVLIIHGAADERIKASYSELVYRAANDPKELWLLPKARHHDMAEIGGEEYLTRICTFFETHLPQPELLRPTPPSYSENQ
jgi:dipeptidyl aminopeptidase/acylaminoacyl peptidase